jgi:putative MATE family efflux protein
MLQNVVAGLQGIIDHTMVGHMVGFTGNAAIGVSWQLMLVVIVFISALFTGMAVLVARFAGANEPDKVNRVVYQSFLTAAGLAAVMAVVGYAASPMLLRLVNAAPAVQREALPFLRTMFLGGIGMMTFFMLCGAFRAAGDARTPLKLGISLTVLTIAFNVVLIPIFGTVGAAYGTVTSNLVVSAYGVWKLFSQDSVINLREGIDLKPDFAIIRSLFRFGLPTGVQGIAMNIGGVLMLRFIGSLEHSAAAQAAFAVGYTQLFSLIAWTAQGLLGAATTIAGQNLGAGKPDRAAAGVWMAARIGLVAAAVVAAMFVLMPGLLLGIFAMNDPFAVLIGEGLLGYLAVSGFFVTLALSYTGGLQGTGDTKSPLYISVVSQFLLPIGLCSAMQVMHPLQPSDIWLAIVLGHVARGLLSVWRFRQGRWRSIVVDINLARS